MIRISHALLLVALSSLFLASLLSTSSVSAHGGHNHDHDHDETDHYTVLGLQSEREDASEADIKKRYRTLSLEHHPDRGGNADTYRKIQAAYDVLGDKRKRKIYDIRGEDGLKQMEESKRNPHQHMMMDPFAQMFGGGQQMQQGGVGKGPDANLNLQVPLSEIYNGAQHKISITKQKLCRTCKGTGAASKADFQKCTQCKGSGHVKQRIQLMPGFVQESQAPCPKCGGKGKQIKKKCPACKGNKVFRGDQQLEIDIEQGIPDGHKITLEMEADQNPDQIPGDVIFKVQTVPDKSFTRDGDTLDHAMSISLKEALFGFSKRIVHMDGRAVEVDRTDVTQHGYRQVIKGEGMPKHGVPSERGDLGVTFNVQFPRKLTVQQKNVIAKALKYTPPTFEVDDEE